MSIVGVTWESECDRTGGTASMGRSRERSRAMSSDQFLVPTGPTNVTA